MYMEVPLALSGSGKSQVPEIRVHSPPRLSKSRFQYFFPGLLVWPFAT